MTWHTHLRGDPVAWVLTAKDPGVRYLALRDLADPPPDDRTLAVARAAAHTHGPIATLLAHMHPAGFWAKPGPGYLPKYRSTVWALTLLAQLGASVSYDERIARACAYALDHALTADGQFTASGAPAGTADCLQGNLCWALVTLGCEAARLDKAFEWMARTVTGEGLAPVGARPASLRYFAGKCGPVFACGANNRLPCAWGAAKVMLAFGAWPAARRTPLIQRAIAAGTAFLFSVDPATAAYPSGYSPKPSGNWWKFGFPVFYVTDLLQVLEALTALGHGADRRLQAARQLVLDKQDAEGRWALEYSYAGKTWGDFGRLKHPNPWVTLRALRVLKAAG